MFYFAILKILKFIFNYLSTVTACYLKILKKVIKYILCICIVTKYSTYLNYKRILPPIPFPRKVLVTTVTLLPATHSFSIGSSVSNLPEQCLHTVLFGIKTKLSPCLCTFCMIPELNTLVNASVGPNGIFSNEWQMILGLEEFGDVSFSEL